MHGSAFDNPALSVALALAAGMVAQTLARHLRTPGIVALLAAGVVLGPDLLGIIRPTSLGHGMHLLVGFAVAIILFEGGMALDLRRLRREARSIRQLVTLGAFVTFAGGMLTAYSLMKWDWTTAFLFGSLVVVTGPTVITPLLRRLKVKHRVSTVLEAEGVLVDAVGAIFAAVALQVAIRPSGEAMAFAAGDYVVRIAFGIVLGLAGGFLIALLLRRERLVPEGLENVFTLSIVVALFQFSNAIFQESGIMTVTIAGLTVGNIKTRVLRDLRGFKEQLTTMLIGMLFVLLAADVRLADVRALGAPGVWTVLALMFLVRPLNILIGTMGSELTWREKTFLSWLAPRGIVAAAGASLVADALISEGNTTGHELRALVFLVIAITVTVQGLTGGLVARALGLRRPPNNGYAILGANRLACELARVLQESAQDVVLLETNHEASNAAEEAGFRVLHGSGLDERILIRAEIDTRIGAIGLTTNDEVNLLFAQRTRGEFKVAQAWVAIRRSHLSVTPKMVHHAGARYLFGAPRNVDLWTFRLERELARLEVWQRTSRETITAASVDEMQEEIVKLILPLVIRRGKKVAIIDEATEFRQEDEVYFIVSLERQDEYQNWLRAQGWEPVEATVPSEPSPTA